MNIHIALTKFTADILDVLHFFVIFFPILIYIIEFPIYVVRFAFLLASGFVNGHEVNCYKYSYTNI